MLIRAVVTDIDGTIARADGSVSAATVRAGRERAARGIPLIAATARTPAGLAALEPVMPAFTAAVCCNGSLGLDMQAGQTLWQESLGAAASTRIISVLTAQLPDAGIAAFDGREWILTANFLAIRGNPPRGPFRVAGTGALAGAAIAALAVCHPRVDAAHIARQLLSAGITPADAILTHAADHLLDIAPPGTGKASGVARVLDRLGIRPAHAVAFGDAPNDIPLLRLAGHSVAMADAHPDALAAAGTVTESVARDGFSHELRRLGLIAASPQAATPPQRPLE
ncbi:MAG TPA: HAD family hydrolase [Streptosporangiaceae bacterium]|nr:HAD family hydrolase [Streptosporangiaceae bacterium]